MVKYITTFCITFNSMFAQVYPILDENGTNYYFERLGVGTILEKKSDGSNTQVSISHSDSYTLLNNEVHDHDRLGQYYTLLSFQEFIYHTNVQVGTWIKSINPAHPYYNQIGQIVRITSNNQLGVDYNLNGSPDGWITNNPEETYYILIDPDLAVSQTGFNNSHVGSYVKILQNNPNYNRLEGDILQIVGVYANGNALLASVSDGFTINYQFKDQLWQFHDYASTPDNINLPLSTTLPFVFKQGFVTNARLDPQYDSGDGVFYDVLFDWVNYEQWKYLYFQLQVNLQVTFKPYTNVPYGETAGSIHRQWEYEVEITHVRINNFSTIDFPFRPYNHFQRFYEYDDDFWMWLQQAKFRIAIDLNINHATELIEFEGPQELEFTTYNGNHVIDKDDIAWIVNRSFKFKTPGHKVVQSGDLTTEKLSINTFEGNGVHNLNLFGNNANALYQIKTEVLRDFRSTKTTEPQTNGTYTSNTPFENETIYFHFNEYTFEQSNPFKIPYAQDLGHFN